MSISEEHPVLSLMRERARQGSLPGKRKDSYKLGLAVEGGAMRGVISAGMLLGLEYLQLLNVFDEVYGASAGAFNGAYFLAQQAAYGTTIYYNNINNRRFIDVARVLSKQPIANLDYIFDNVILNEKLLDYQAVLNSNISLNVVASSLGKFEAVVFNKFRTREELFKALHASSKMPVVAGAPVEIGGDLYLDASLCEGIPIYSALGNGCTHVLVALTRPEGQLKRKNNIVDSLIARKLEKVKKGLGVKYLDSNRRYNETLAYLYQMNSSQDQNPSVLSICLPGNMPPLSKTEKRREVLKHAAAVGMAHSISTITGESVQVTEVLAPFDQRGHMYRAPWSRQRANE